ncbi:sugar transferase [Burkholderiales bacterium]|nr:sugar transferase [Burkholderiales bacterium]
MVATDDLDDPNKWITPLGYYLRKTSIDELPQLWSILKGEMSFVGPRPALVSEKKLINIRTDKMIHTLVPGLTGLAQVNGRDEISVLQKVNYDLKYYENLSILLDMKIIITTVYRVLLRQGITH